VLVAYESLQDAIHKPDVPFHSFRKVIQNMPSPYNNLELFSVHSSAKTPYFESSYRAAFFDILNIDKEVTTQVYKYKSIDLCSNIPGQLVMDLVLSPPRTPEFGADFVEKYQASLDESKKENKEIVEKVRNILTKNKDLEVPTIDAGFSFFCGLKHGNSKAYVEKMLSQNGVFICNGEDFGSNNEKYVNIYANINAVTLEKFERLSKSIKI